MAKRIHFYASEEDQKLIAQIQEIKPHWKNVNMIIREGLFALLQSLRQSTPALPNQPYQSTLQPRFIKED